MWKEFKEFAMKGNIIDLAIGVIIGGAFQKIVSSLVNDIIMPAISIFTGKVDYSDLCFTFGQVSIKYGAFLTTVLDFLIIAFSIFLVVRYLNKLNRKLEQMKNDEFNKINEKLAKKHGLFKNRKKKKEEAKPIQTTKICPYCCSEIPIKAIKCAHCTSDQPDLEEHKADFVEGQLEIK